MGVEGHAGVHLSIDFLKFAVLALLSDRVILVGASATTIIEIFFDALLDIGSLLTAS